MPGNFINVPGLPGVFYDLNRQGFFRRTPMSGNVPYSGPIPAGFQIPGQQQQQAAPPGGGFAPGAQPGGLVPQAPTTMPALPPATVPPLTPSQPVQVPRLPAFQLPPLPTIATPPPEAFPELPQVTVPSEPLAGLSTQAISQRLGQLQDIIASGGRASPVFTATAGQLADQFIEDQQQLAQNLARAGLTGSGLAFGLAQQAQRQREKGLENVAAQQFKQASSDIADLLGLTERARLSQRELAVKAQLDQLDIGARLMQNREALRSREAIAQLNAQTQQQLTAMQEQVRREIAQLQAEAQTLMQQMREGGATERVQMQLDNALERIRLQGEIDKDIAEKKAENNLEAIGWQAAAGLLGPKVVDWGAQLLQRIAIDPLDRVISWAIDTGGDFLGGLLGDIPVIGDLFGGGGGGDVSGGLLPPFEDISNLGLNSALDTVFGGG